MHTTERHSAWRSSVRPAILSTVITLIAASASAQALPSGWTATDIGSPSLHGSATFSSDTFSVSGSGSDVWGSADQFTFVHRQLTGDGVLVARVASIQNTHAWAKAGVMMRESLSPGSRYGFALVSPGNGIAYQRRTSTSGSSINTAASGAAPVWLRMQRAGTTFTASRSSDGMTWVTIAAQNISMASTIYVGLAVTSHNTSALAQGVFSNVSFGTPATVAGTSLPTGWTSSDIGARTLPGSAAFSTGTFSIEGGGRDIWYSSDEFRFTYQQMSGDGDIVARVASVESVDPWTKAGVMIRRSLTASSAHASVFVSSAKGVAFQWRPSDGAASSHTAGGGRTAPWWVKLSRRGSTITASQSSDGTSWSAIGTQTLSLGATYYVGLAVTSHKTSALATAEFSNVSVLPVTAPVPPNQSPTVSLTSPASGASFTAPATVSLGASAADTDGTVARVDFYAGSSLVGSDTTAPYTVSWSSVPAGTYSITAVARDNGGASATSSARSFTVSSAGNQPPTVSLTAPANGATLTAPASVTVSAAASDGDGTVASVAFYAGQTLIGTDTAAPYAVSWPNVIAGSYSLTAVARDNVGATTVSGARSITVQAVSMPGRAVFTPSSNHATAVDRYVVDFFTAGADPTVSNPVASVDVGKPAIVNGDCSADVSQAILGLVPGTYIATITAVGPGGSTQSAPSSSFLR